MKRVLLLCLFLVACDRVPSSERTSNYVLPRGLEDCYVYKVNSVNSEPDLTVIRCANSTTATRYTEQVGKIQTTRTNIVIDGVEYVKKDK